MISINIRKTLSFFLIGLITIVVSAASPSRGKVAFRSISVGDGLPHSDVNAIVQDNTGYMWFATYGGLCRYNGYSIETFRSDNSGLSRDRIISLYVSTDSLLYIGSESDGLMVYDSRDNSFRHVTDFSTKNHRVADDVVNCIFQDEEDVIWICHNNCLSKVVGDGLKTAYRTSSTTSSVMCGMSIGINHVLFSTFEGVKLYDKTTGRCVPALSELGYVTSFYEKKSETSGHKVYLAGGSFGVAEISAEMKSKVVISNISVRTLLQDSRGHIWVGSYDNGLFEYDSNYNLLGHYTPDPFQMGKISSSEISSLYEDRSGMLWVGTIGGGLNTLDLKGNNISLYTIAEGLSQNRVITFTEDANDYLWISTHDGGIDIFDTKHQSFNNLMINGAPSSKFHVVSSFWNTLAGDIWLGTWNNGVYIVPKEEIAKLGREKFEVTARKISGSLVSGVSVFKIIDDRDGHIWLSTNSGVLEYNPSLTDASNNPNSWREYRYDNMNYSSLSSDFVTDICPDPDTDNKVIWIGTRTGLNKLTFDKDGSSRMQRVTLNGDKSVFVSVIYRDSRGLLWISTLGDGLYLMTDGRLNDNSPSFINYNSANCGFISNEMESLLEDSSGNFWIGGYGIARFSPMMMVDESGNEKKMEADTPVKIYTEKDNLQSNSFKIWADYRMRDGRVVFGGIKGFNIFNPDSILVDTIPPRTVISEVRVKNVRVTVNDAEALVLPHNQNSISFSLSALSYKAPLYNQYKYKLEGYEDKWNYTNGRDPQCVYSNLKKGHYTFLLVGSNSDGTWSSSPVTLEITILPHFLQSPIAIVLYLILFGLFAYLIYIISIRRIKSINERKNEQEKLRFFTDMAHEIKTPLSLISAPVEDLLDSPTIGASTRNKLSIVSRSIESLKSVVEQILDLRKYETKMMNISVAEVDICRFLNETAELFRDFAQSKNINFRTEICDSSQMVFIDKNKMERVVINLLSNAFKFTPTGGSICLSCEGDNKYVVFSVEDNGVGISEEDKAHIFNRFYQGHNQTSHTSGGTGIGLSLSKYIINHHKGEISVESRKNFGSKFTVRLLKGSSHFSADVINPDYRNSDDLSNYDPLNTRIQMKQNVSEGNNEDVPTKVGMEASILVVDDNDQLREYLVELLSDKYNILSADNGMSAYEIAIAEQPDLILSDIVMPEMSGIDLCRRIKNNNATSHIIVVLLTARDLVATEVDSWRMGADAFIKKPFHTNILLSRIENLLGSRERMRKSFRGSINVHPSDITVVTFDEKLMKKCLDAIEESIDNPNFGVDELCNAVGVSRAQLYRKISSITGLSPLLFIRSIRLKRAAQILLRDNTSISSVMYQVGFNNLSYFSKLFKEEFGCMPKEYKQKMASGGAEKR